MGRGAGVATGRGAAVARGAGVGVARSDGWGSGDGLGAGGTALGAAGLGRGTGGTCSRATAGFAGAGWAASGSGFATGAGAPSSGATSAAASSLGSGEVEVRPTESVRVTVMRSGGGMTGVEGGFQASQAISSACRLAATTSPKRSSFAGLKVERLLAVKASALRTWVRRFRLPPA